MANDYCRLLPVGIQSFEKIRKEGYLYVDKTDIIWQLANRSNTYNYLSRPRRFGKSVLIDTLEAYFLGKKELFEGLKIMDLEREWIKRPVIRLDMSRGGANASELKAYLNRTFEEYEQKYSINITETDSLANRFDLIINSFPTTRNNKVLTTAILAPQNPYPLVEEGYVYTNEEYNWGNGKYEPMSTNGWGQSSAPMISIIDSNNNELTESKTAEGGDYKNYIRRITFWDSAFGKTVSIKATSSYYPDIVLTTTPFLVTTPTGINGVTTDNNQEKPAVYYNLNGQRVDKPTHGIYIANGKKVIIR